MLFLALSALFPLAATLVHAAPQNDPTSGEPTEPQEQSSSFDKSWEIIIIVVFVVLISGLIGVCLWVRIRRRRRNTTLEDTRRSGRITSPYRNFARFPSTTEVSKEAIITAPLPIVPYDRRSKDSSSFPPNGAYYA